MIEVIVYKTFEPILAGLISYVFSFFITHECILCYKNNNTDSQSDINLNNMHMEIAKYETKKTKNSLITFNNTVEFIIIPNINSITEEDKKELWYSSEEYNKFKDDIINNKK